MQKRVIVFSSYHYDEFEEDVNAFFDEMTAEGCEGYISAVTESHYSVGHDGAGKPYFVAIFEYQSSEKYYRKGEKNNNILTCPNGERCTLNRKFGNYLLTRLTKQSARSTS